MFRLADDDRRHLGLLLTPSWLSGLVAVVVGLAFSIGVVVVFEANNSSLQQQLLAWQQNQPQKALTTPDQTLPQSDKPTLQGSWPLLLLWSLAGLVIYAIAAAIVRSLARAEELRESLDYVNARPRAMLAETAEHLLLRGIAAVVLIVFLVAFWHQVVPYSITAAHASAADVLSLDGGLYALLSFALIALSIHVQTILLRLALGRARVFPEA
jgi:hypothetical protein